MLFKEGQFFVSAVQEQLPLLPDISSKVTFFWGWILLLPLRHTEGEGHARYRICFFFQRKRLHMTMAEA